MPIDACGPELKSDQPHRDVLAALAQLQYTRVARASRPRRRFAGVSPPHRSLGQHHPERGPGVGGITDRVLSAPRRYLRDELWSTLFPATASVVRLGRGARM